MGSDVSKDSIFSYGMQKIPTLIFRIILVFGGLYLFKMLMNEANGKMGEKMKFDIKTAGEIH